MAASSATANRAEPGGGDFPRARNGLAVRAGAAYAICMKSLAAALGLCLGIFQTQTARADDLDFDLDRDRRGPAVRLGFQMALRGGYAHPLGRASGASDGKMSDVTTGQIPVIVELGGKVVPNLFLGGYLGIAGGLAAGNLDDLCDEADYDCYALGIRAGLEGHFQLVPHGRTNPWIGYGIGYETLTVSMSDGDDTGSFSVSGPEYARVMAGLDFRLSRGFGLGPFLDVSIGKYTQYKDDPPGGESDDGDIPKTGMHEWVTVGARFVFFP